MTSVSFIINCLFINTIFIYFKIIPIDIETQPFVAFSLASIFFATRFIDSREVHRDEMYVIALIVILFLYLLTGLSGVVGVGAISEFVKFSLGPFFYLAIRNYTDNIKIFSLKFIAFIFLTYILLSFIFGVAFINQLPVVTARAVDRWTFYSAEPSYFAPILCVLLIFCDKLKNSNGEQASVTHELLLLKLFFVFCGILTASAYVYLVILIYSIINFVAKKSFLYFITAICILLTVLIPSLVYVLYFADLEGLQPGRLTNLLRAISNLVTNKSDIMSFIFKAEPSGTTRIILNYLAFSVPLTISPLGLGFGGFQLYWLDIARTLNVPIYDHEVLSQSIKPVSQTYFSNLSSSIGLFSLIYFGIVFIGNIRTKNICPESRKIYFFSLSMIFIFTFFQLQVTNPILWLLIATLKKPRLIQSY